MNKRKIAIMAIAVIVASVIIQYLSPLLFGAEVDFEVSAVLSAIEEQRYILLFIDNVGDQSLKLSQIDLADSRVFPGQPVSVSVDGEPMHMVEEVILNPTETCLVKIDATWDLGEEYNVKVSASAVEGSLLPKVRTQQVIVKAPSSLRDGDLLTLGSVSASKEDGGSLSAGLTVEANGLDWVRIMIFSHFAASWPGYKPVKFYYDPSYTFYFNSTSEKFYHESSPNSAIGSEADVMDYYEKVSEILSSAGIEVEMIDSFGLWNLMIEMQPAMVIMGADILPKFGNPPIWHGETDQQSLTSRWLKSGGVLMWIGDYLGFYYGEPKNGSRMYIPVPEELKIHIGRILHYCERGDWWLLGYDPIGGRGGYINMPLTPTRAGKTLGLRTSYVDRPVLLKGERQGPELPTNAYLYGRYEEKLKEWAWSSAAYLPMSEGQGGVWYMGVQESSPVRWMKDVRARFPAWDDIEDIAWDTASVIIHSVWTGLTGQGEQDTGHCYFATDKSYISGELRLSTLPLSYAGDLDTVTVRIVAIGYSSESQQYLYDEKIASIDV